MTHLSKWPRMLQSRAQGMGSALRLRFAADAPGLVLVAAVLVLALGAFLSNHEAWRPGSDGFYNYVYARSLAFDGDLDFANDYQLCGDPFGLGQDRGTGRPDNIFYAGPALFWTPVLLVLRGLGVSGNGCGLPWSFYCLLVTPVLASISAFFTYRFVLSWFSRGVSAAATGLIFLGGPVLLLAAALPSYSHVYELFFVSLVCWLSAKLGEPGCRRCAIWLGLALAGAILQRLSNLSFVALPLVALWTRSRGSARWFDTLCVAVGAGAACLVQASINAALYGSVWSFSHGPYFLNFQNAHPFLTLFDAEEGFFLFWPTAWLAVLGMLLAKGPAWRRTFWVLLGLSLFELGLNSAALDWAPARRFLKLAPFLALVAANTLARAADWLSQKPERWRAAAATAALVPLAAWSAGLAYGAPRGAVKLDRPLRQETLYGAGTSSFFRWVDKRFGALPIAPAEWWFSARYALPADAFGAACHARFYVRDFRSLRWIDRRIDLGLLSRQGLTEGLAAAPGGGVRLGAETARAVFATQWPHVTHVVVSLRPRSTQRFTIGFGTAFGIEWLDPQVVPPSERVSFDVRHLELGSGLHELHFRVEGASDGFIIDSVEFDDRTPRAPLVP